MQDPELRRLSHAGLNKGAAKRVTPRGSLSIVSAKSATGHENPRYRVSGLNLIVAAIVLWNTVYLQRAIDYLRSQRHDAEAPRPGAFLATRLRAHKSHRRLSLGRPTRLGQISSGRFARAPVGRVAKAC
jgi:hypothetical protein